MREQNETMFSSASASSTKLALRVGIGGVVVGTAAGVLAGAQPLYLGLLLCSLTVLFYFFADFERAVLGLLILRSSIDIFTVEGMPSALQQIPAAYAVGIDALTVAYVVVLLLTRQKVRVDKFWWVFACWIALQGFWVILLALGGLGLDASYLPVSIREWVRLFTWLMVYLLVMQLKGRVPPKRIISLLFLSLVIPLSLALMQLLVPTLLPPVLVEVPGADGFRVRGTAGHPNSFAVYLWLFIALTWWKLTTVKRRWPWILLLSLLTLILVSTKTLVVLVLLAAFCFFLNAPRLNLLNIIGGIILFSLVLALFASTEYGQQRLASIANTPLLNPDIDASTAIILSNSDQNSFNWRIAQWTYLIKQWQQFPMLGYGLGTSNLISTNKLLPHNDYIRALIEGGIIGLAAYLSLIVAKVVRLVQLLRSSPRGSDQYELCFVLLAIVIALPIGMITENVWSCTAFYFYLWATLAIAGWNWNETS